MRIAGQLIICTCYIIIQLCVKLTNLAIGQRILTSNLHVNQNLSRLLSVNYGYNNKGVSKYPHLILLASVIFPQVSQIQSSFMLRGWVGLREPVQLPQSHLNSIRTQSRDSDQQPLPGRSGSNVYGFN